MKSPQREDHTQFQGMSGAGSKEELRDDWVFKEEIEYFQNDYDENF